MEVKMLEIRDRATFIPAMAIKLSAQNSEQQYLLGRAGYGSLHPMEMNYVILIKMVGEITAKHDPFAWTPITIRTMHVAHKHILDNWKSLKDGDVVDVEFVLYETKEMKVSERYG